MSSTSTPKAIEPHNALVARADEQLAHAHEQIARAGEELARLSEQIAKMERDSRAPTFGRTWPAITAQKAGAPDPRRLAAGGVRCCRCLGFAVVLWRRGQAGCRPLGAAARFNCIIAAGKYAASRAAHSIYRSAARSIYRSIGCGGGSTTASNALTSDRTARRRADSYRGACRSDTVAANDGSRSRECGAKHRTAQGEPATNSQRQFKSHWGAQGEPGRDKTRAREGFRAEPAQDVTASDAAGSNLAQARADASLPVRESAASNPKGLDLRRRLVAVDAVIIEGLSCNNASMRYSFKGEKPANLPA